MGTRTIIALAVLAAALTAHALLFERDRGDVFGGPGKVFGELEPADVIRLEIEYRGGDARVRAGLPESAAEPFVIGMRRRGEFEWLIERPFTFPGLVPRIQGLTWGLADLVQVDVIPEGTSGYTDAIPSSGAETVIRFSTRQGEEHTIELGRDFPEASMDYMYIRVDRTEVHVVRRDLRRTFAVGLGDLRSRALFPIARPDAVALKVTARDPRWNKEFARQPGAAWFFAGAPELEGVLADRVELGKLIDELNAWKIESFELDAAGEISGETLASFGLDAPGFRVWGKHENGRATAFDVGAALERDGRQLVYVRSAGEPHVFTAEAGPVAAALRLEAADLRTVHVFDFEGASIVRIDASGASGEFSLIPRESKANAAKDGGEAEESPREDRWVIAVPGSDVELAGDRHLIGIAVAELRELLIREYLPPLPDGAESSGFDLQVAVTLDSGRRSWMRLGPRWQGQEDRGLELYEGVRSEDRSHFAVDTLWPQRLAIGASVFRDRAISTIEPHRIHGLEVRTAARAWQLARIPGHGWSLPAGERILAGQSLDGKLVDQLAAALGRESFRVYQFDASLPKTEFDGWGIGRTAFRHVVTVTHVEGDPKGFRSLIVGHQKPNSQPAIYYSRTDSEDCAILLESGLPQIIERLVAHLEAITGSP